MSLAQGCIFNVCQYLIIQCYYRNNNLGSFRVMILSEPCDVISLVRFNETVLSHLEEIRFPFVGKMNIEDR